MTTTIIAEAIPVCAGWPDEAIVYDDGLRSTVYVQSMYNGIIVGATLYRDENSALKCELTGDYIVIPPVEGRVMPSGVLALTFAASNTSSWAAPIRVERSGVAAVAESILTSESLNKEMQR